MADTRILYKKMLRLVLPISFQQFMCALVGASDAVMLGKLNQDSMSAVSLASQVNFVFSLFMTTFIIGEKRITLAFQKYSVLSFGFPVLWQFRF